MCVSQQRSAVTAALTNELTSPPAHRSPSSKWLLRAEEGTSDPKSSGAPAGSKVHLQTLTQNRQPRQAGGSEGDHEGPGLEQNPGRNPVEHIYREPSTSDSFLHPDRGNHQKFLRSSCEKHQTKRPEGSNCSTASAEGQG